MELLDLPSLFRGGSIDRTNDFAAVLDASVRERGKTAFTKRTWELISQLHRNDSSMLSATLLVTSCVPEHAWNADFLTSLLGPSDEASWWRAGLDQGVWDVSRAVRNLAAWASEVDVNRADPEVLRLAVVTMVWLLDSSLDSLRSEAMRGLTRLLGATTALKDSVVAFLDRAPRADDLLKEAFGGDYSIVFRRSTSL